MSKDQIEQRLRKTISFLQKQNKYLKSKLREVAHPTIRAGIHGEELLIRLVKGAKSKKNASYDLKLKNGRRVEVKYSNLTSATSYKNKTYLRWTWSGLIAGPYNVKKKQYSYLVLIGENRGRHKIGADRSHRTYFLLPKQAIKSIVDPKDHRGHINFFPLPGKQSNDRRDKLLKYRKTKSQIMIFFKQVARVKE